jgi:hypothetical protein
MGACTANRVLYQHADSLGGQEDLYVVREDGSNRAVLANSVDDEIACGVTTDRRIVFTRITPNGGDIYIVNEDGTGAVALRSSSADEECFGVTGHNMVIFGITRTVTNHDIYSLSANAVSTDPAITLSATTFGELSMAIGWDDRILYAKQDVAQAVDGHRYSFYSVADDGTQPAHVVRVLEEPSYVGQRSTGLYCCKERIEKGTSGRLAGALNGESLPPGRPSQGRFLPSKDREARQTRLRLVEPPKPPHILRCFFRMSEF